jgi:hypothetical protein
MLKGAGQQILNWQQWQASQDFLGAGYNYFLSFGRQASLNLSPAYLENLFQIKTWKIELSGKDLHGNFKSGLLYQTYFEK